MSTTTPLDQQRQLVHNFLAANKQRADRENACQKQFSASEAATQQQHSTAEKTAQTQHAAALQQAAYQRNQSGDQLRIAADSIEEARFSAVMQLAAMGIASRPASLEMTKAIVPSSGTNVAPLPQFQFAAEQIGDLAEAIARTLGEWQQQRKRQQVLRVAGALATVVLVVVSVVLFRQWSYDRNLSELYRTGVAALEAGKWQTARKQFDELLALEPGYQDVRKWLAESYYRPGVAALEAGEWQTARELFDKLLTLEPRYQDAQTLRQESLYGGGKAALGAAFDANDTQASITAFKELNTQSAIFTQQQRSELQTLSDQFAEQAGLRFDFQDGAIYVRVPAGEFLMGSSDGQGDDNERPQHTVNLDAYWIMQTEVTNGRYAQCVAAGACSAPNNSIWQDADRADHPVTHVTWQQASDYATWTGGRLPTEAEWEKAACGTDGRIYPWGDAAPMASLLNFADREHFIIHIGQKRRESVPWCTIMELNQHHSMPRNTDAKYNRTLRKVTPRSNPKCDYEFADCGTRADRVGERVL